MADKKKKSSKSTTKKTATKTVAKKATVEEKGSLLSNLSPRVEKDGRISFTKMALAVFGVITAVLIGCSFVIGHNVELTNPFVQTQDEIQAKIEKNLAEDIKKINESLTSGMKLESKATYTQSGEIMDYEYYQYIAYTDDMNAYVCWVVNSENGELLSVWTAEQHLKGTKSTTQIILKNLVEKTYKDKLSKDSITEIMAHIDDKESYTFSEDNFGYLSEYTEEDLPEGYDYARIYELDFFKYIPSNDGYEAVVEDGAEASENAK